VKKLFDTSGKQKQQQESKTAAQQLKKRLADGLKKNKKLFRKAPKAWEDALEILLELHSRQHIEFVMDWALSHPNHPKAVKIKDAYTFCERFDALRVPALFEKMPDGEISNAAKKLARNTHDCAIPTQLQPVWKTVCHRNIDLYQPFLEGKVIPFAQKWTRLAKKDPEDDDPKEVWLACARARKLSSLVRYLINVGVFMVDSGLMMMLDRACRRCTKFYNPSLFLFSPDNDAYRELGEYYTEQYTEDPTRWADLLKEILTHEQDPV